MENSTEQTRRWLKGIPYEVAFWRSYYSSRKRRKRLFEWSLYGKPCSIDNFDIQTFVRSLTADAGEPLILDVGCALSYMFGNIFDGREVKIDYIDPLAVFYNRILDDFSIDRPRIRFGMIEQLSASYAPDSADFIHIRNALDHCADPMTGILQALTVAKIGGIVYLNHHRDEAVREAYRGFHQYNITEEAGKLVIWNRHTRIDVAEALKNFAEVECSVTKDDFIVAVIRKTGPVSRSLCSPESTAVSAMDILQATVSHFHSFPASASYQLSRLVTTVGHRTMRLIPFSWVKAIKRLLK